MPQLRQSHGAMQWPTVIARCVNVAINKKGILYGAMGLNHLTYMSLPVMLVRSRDHGTPFTIPAPRQGVNSHVFRRLVVNNTYIYGVRLCCIGVLYSKHGIATSNTRKNIRGVIDISKTVDSSHMMNKRRFLNK